MIINTDLLKMAVQSRDDDVDWEKCSISSLNFMEKRCLDSLDLIDKIETLNNDLIVNKP